MELADQVGRWLLTEALGDPDLVQLFDGLCVRLAGIGIPIARARLTWSTLHPLFRAEMIKWQRGDKAELEHFPHQDANTEAWQRSPLRFMLESRLDVLRRRLSGPGKLLDFLLFEELAAEGYTDYLALSTSFEQPGMFVDSDRTGIIVIWTSDRPNGFTDEDLQVLQEIQSNFALVCKTIIQGQITRNIVQTYLGPQAGRSVLGGNIRLGDGTVIEALVWYSDLRGSTRLTGSLPSDEFLALLNSYFECAARPAVRAGGEILAFIGDAVLVIFPLKESADLPGLAITVLEAVEASFDMQSKVNEERERDGREPIQYGIGLNMGRVVFGNIGVPERLAFTVIGSTVTEVERIEKLTKQVEPDILASADVARVLPERWRSVGEYRLDGMELPTELFTLRGLKEPHRPRAAAPAGPWPAPAG